jgi:hypothetical protein
MNQRWIRNIEKTAEKTPPFPSPGTPGEGREGVQSNDLALLI